MTFRDNTMKLSAGLSILFAALFTCGCSYKVGPEISDDNHFSNPHSSEQNLNLDSKKSLGIALSGGGVRSALFNIGVLKALYDENITQKSDVMSAVSGGGYALYWLLTSQMTPDGEVDTSMNLGDNVFKNENGTDNFLLSTCNLMTYGNFALDSNLNLLRNAAFNRQNYYRGQIVRTFGHIDDLQTKYKSAEVLNNTAYGKLTIDKFQGAVDHKKLPYFIFNATASDIENHQNSKQKFYDNGWRNGLFEFTPFFRGNERLGYVDWSNGDSLPLSRIAAISGAAVKPLLSQNFSEPYDSIRYTLADGGHSENLGAIALIKRGVKNIILIDAEMDDELAFEGYYILKDRSLAWGFKLKNDFLDSRARIKNEKEFWLRESTPPLKNSEFEVEVTDLKGRHISTIYYIKMAVVGELKKELEDKYYSYIKGMKNSDQNLSENAKIRKALIEEAKNSNNKGDWDCTALVSKPGNFDTIKWITQEAIYRANDKYADNFPHKTTFDQSWYNDEVVSWIGLGYLQGQRLVDKYHADFDTFKVRE